MESMGLTDMKTQFVKEGEYERETITYPARVTTGKVVHDKRVDSKMIPVQDEEEEEL